MSTPTSETEAVVSAFGRSMREHRRRKRMSLADLSAATGLSTTHCHTLEKGFRSLKVEHVIALANVLDMPLHGILLAPDPAEGTEMCDQTPV